MDKIQISTKTQSLTIRLTEEKAKIKFMELVGSLIYTKNNTFDSKQIVETVKTNIQENGQSQYSEIYPEKSKKEDKESSVMKYKGFLYIKCGHCGKEKGFSAKNEIDGYYCDECKKQTKFISPLKRMYLNCECGQSSYYYTNMTEDMFDVDCIQCGQLVAVKYNDKKGLYESIK